MNANAPDRGTVTAALGLAVRAPSLHNSQPWQWRVADHSLHLYADPCRLLAAADPAGRELVISCGAALHHARIAFASLGWRTFVHRLPNPSEPDHLAALEFTRLPGAPEHELAQASAIPVRRSDRRPFLQRPVPPAILRRLATVAWRERGILTVAGTPYARRELGVAMSMVNELQRQDPQYRIELAAWAGRGLGAVDGVPASALRAAAPTRSLLGRDFSAAGAGDLSTPAIDDGAEFAVLGTERDDRHCWLLAGEALSAVLLTAAAHGLATCTLSQVAEADEARDVVRAAALDDGEPQLLVRIGWPVTATYPAPASPRRPISEVVGPLLLNQ